MKKLIIVFSMFFVLLFGITTVKADVVSMGLKELVADEITQMKGKEGTEEYIKKLEEADLSKYKESDDKVNVYIFRGSTCGYCLKAAVYFTELSKTMGDKFNIVSYEVWENQDNVQVLMDVAKVFNESPSGVPYIVVGEKTFNGYAESFNSEIEAEINKQYKLKKRKRFDVMVEKDKTPPTYTPVYIFVIVSVALLIINIISISLVCVKVKKMQKALAIETNRVIELNESKTKKVEIKEQAKKTTSKKTTSKSTKKSK